MEKMIDCKGMACPLPVVNAKKASEELSAGDVLTVLVDNEIAVQNLTRFAEHKGFGVSAEKKADKEYAVIMTVSGAAAGPDPVPAQRDFRSPAEIPGPGNGPTAVSWRRYRCHGPGAFGRWPDSPA